MSWVTIVPEQYEGDEDAMLLVSFLELVSWTEMGRYLLGGGVINATAFPES
jgi:hypothetical protein